MAIRFLVAVKYLRNVCSHTRRSCAELCPQARPLLPTAFLIVLECLCYDDMNYVTFFYKFGNQRMFQEFRSNTVLEQTLWQHYPFFGRMNYEMAPPFNFRRKEKFCRREKSSNPAVYRNYFMGVRPEATTIFKQITSNWI